MRRGIAIGNRTVAGRSHNLAIQHHDSSHGTVRISSRELPKSWEFTVDDDGPGIPEEFHEMVFKIFQTLKPRDEKEGSGMGLSLIKKIVESQDGTISIQPKDGRGTRFCFTWPKLSDPHGE